MSTYDYNTNRTSLLLKEYGRNIQKLANHISHIKDDEQRNISAKVLIDMMKRLNPNINENSESEQKIWDDIVIASDYKLNIETPFGVSCSKPIKKSTNTRLAYKQKEISYKHYGKNTELLIDSASQLEDSDEKDVLIHHIAKLMKSFYMSWNKKIVDDSVIIKNIYDISKGKIVINPKIYQDNPLEELYKDNEKQNNTGTSTHANRTTNKSRKRTFTNRKEGHKNSSFRQRKPN